MGTPIVSTTFRNSVASFLEHNIRTGSYDSKKAKMLAAAVGVATSTMVGWMYGVGNPHTPNEVKMQEILGCIQLYKTGKRLKKKDLMNLGEVIKQYIEYQQLPGHCNYSEMMVKELAVKFEVAKSTVVSWAQGSWAKLHAKIQEDIAGYINSQKNGK